MATFPRIGKSDGFSLVEVLVVVTIMALMASAAVLVMPDNDDRLADRAGAAQTAIAALARESVLGNRVLGLRFEGQGYRIAELRPEGWHILEGSAGAAQAFAPATVTDIRIDGSPVSSGEDTVFRPHIWFLPTGEQPSFDLALGLGGAQLHILGRGHGAPEVRHES